jgi:DNA (cytosine-5)-methyltransferase 1
MTPHSFVDLFSGAGGMSFGFHAHPAFEVVGAVDLQYGKPSSGVGALDCNKTYEANMGVSPWNFDIGELDPSYLRQLILGRTGGHELTVLSACPPCTGFSRVNPQNHMADDQRNSLVGRMALFVENLRPQVFVMENAREVLTGPNRHHLDHLMDRLTQLGYSVHAATHVLSRFGVPQRRERALLIACQAGLQLFTLDDLWAGYRITDAATTVRAAIGYLPPVAAGERHRDDDAHVSPSLGSETTTKRLRSMPHDGGSWADLRNHPDKEEILTPAMLRYIARGKFGSHPDVYGRMWWDRPAPTIKRECAHYGNGRYSHPDQDRLCTVREMGILSGFPNTYCFDSPSVANMYRHVGDAVPPIVSYQLAHLVAWILGAERPQPKDLLLPESHLRVADIIEDEIARLPFG